MNATANPPEQIQAIYQTAMVISRDTRARVAADLAGAPSVLPDRLWGAIIDSRRQAGVCAKLAAAGKQIVRASNPTSRRYVSRAVRNLIAAVRELGEFHPKYVEQVEVKSEASGETVARRWKPTVASVARLDDLRKIVRVRLIEVDSMFDVFEDPMARLLSVMQRAAAVVLEPTMAAKVVAWCHNLESGDRAAG